jgi:D-psicose/D-tagatose/L-ribulose 3-epimerase
LCLCSAALQGDDATTAKEERVKIGFCMLLWTTHVGEEHRPLLQDIEDTGYDGVEVPVFEGEVGDFERVGAMLDDIGLERTAISAIGDDALNPVSPDAEVRRAAVSHLKHVADCTAAVGADAVGGPLQQTLGFFSGSAPTERERGFARDVLREAGDHAGERGVRLVLEAVNRFESYLLTTMDQLADFLDGVDHPAVTGMYDTFHANIEERDPVAAFTDNARHVSHIHLSENDRGVPGRGHVPWPETFAAITGSGYDRWLTIEAFGRGLPDLAAATRIWRDLFESPEAVYREGFEHIRRGLAGASAPA